MTAARKRKETGHIRARAIAPSSVAPNPGTESPRVIGYARVSTDQQSTALQVDALRRAGCDVIETDDGVSGALASRPALDRVLATLRPGDTLVVWRLDRLGRSLVHLVEIVTTVQARGVAFRSLSESIDTTTPTGELVFHLFAALAQFERALIRERTRAGLVAAQSRGVRLGRKPAVKADQVAQARRLMADGMSGRAVAKLIRVSHSALQRALTRHAP